MSSPETEGYINPMKLAEKLGVRPQLIYGMIRRERISTKVFSGKTYVSEAVMTRAVLHRRQVRKKKIKPGEIDPTEEGSIVSWDVDPTGERRVLQVQSAREHLATLKDTKGRTVELRTGGLSQRIKEGQIAIEEPWALLEMVAKQWELQSQPHLYVSLSEWIEANKDTEVEVVESNDDDTPEVHSSSDTGRDGESYIGSRRDAEGDSEDSSGPTEEVP